MLRILLALALVGCAVDAEPEPAEDEGPLTITAVCSSPPWWRDSAYPPGSKVTFDRHTYRARWWTQGQQPGRLGSDVWQDQGACDVPRPDAGPAVCPAPWNSATVYTVGSTVSRDGRSYRARIWTQGTDPRVDRDSWLDLGPCG